jgi:hypothetical protein
LEGNWGRLHGTTSFLNLLDDSKVSKVKWGRLELATLRVRVKWRRAAMGSSEDE